VPRRSDLLRTSSTSGAVFQEGAGDVDVFLTGGGGSVNRCAQVAAGQNAKRLGRAGRGSEARDGECPTKHMSPASRAAGSSRQDVGDLAGIVGIVLLRGKIPSSAVEWWRAFPVAKKIVPWRGAVDDTDGDRGDRSGPRQEPRRS